MPTVGNDCFTRIPIFNENQANLELDKTLGYLKTLPTSVHGGTVHKVIEQNQRLRVQLAQYSLEYKLVCASACDLSLKQDEQAYLSHSPTYVKLFGISDDNARQEAYYQCLLCMHRDVSKALSKAWINLIEPNMRSYPFTGMKRAAPPWWPSTTGPNAVRYDYLEQISKHELITILIHIMDIIVNQDPQNRAASLSLDVASLEKATRLAMPSWFEDVKNPSNSTKPYLTQLFRMLYIEERYLQGRLSASDTICVDLRDSEGITVTNNAEVGQNRGDRWDDFYCQQPNQLDTGENIPHRKAEEDNPYSLAQKNACLLQYRDYRQTPSVALTAKRFAEMKAENVKIRHLRHISRVRRSHGVQLRNSDLSTLNATITDSGKVQMSNALPSTNEFKVKLSDDSECTCSVDKYPRLGFNRTQQQPQPDVLKSDDRPTMAQRQDGIIPRSRRPLSAERPILHPMGQSLAGCLRHHRRQI